jgi:hypothetical protein
MTNVARNSLLKGLGVVLQYGAFFTDVRERAVVRRIRRPTF